MQSQSEIFPSFACDLQIHSSNYNTQSINQGFIFSSVTQQIIILKCTHLVEKKGISDVVSLHEYTGLLKNNNKYSQKSLSQKNNRIEIECF